MLVTVPCSSRIGLRLAENFPAPPWPPHDLQFQIVDLLAIQGALQRLGQSVHKTAFDQFKQGTPQQFPLLETGIVPAAIGVTDQTGCVRHQNQALRIAKNLAGEIALAIQFRLISAKTGHIEHQSADLQKLSMVVVQAEGVDQNVNRRTILAAQRRFKVAQAAALRHHFGVLLPLFGREIKLRGNIDLQQFLAAAVSQHPHHGVIDFDEAAARRAEKQAFLNVIEQFAIAPLGLACHRRESIAAPHAHRDGRGART